MVNKFQRAWRNNIAAAFIIGMSATLAVGLQFAQAFTATAANSPTLSANMGEGILRPARRNIRELRTIPKVMH